MDLSPVYRKLSDEIYGGLSFKNACFMSIVKSL